MRYQAEDYFDLMFEDFKVRRDILYAMGVEIGIGGAEIIDPVWRDPHCPPSPVIEFFVFPLYRGRSVMWT